ncbi:MAG: IgGFc-binding protein, partial [Deltaproteobacteria bacterium]
MVYGRLDRAALVATRRARASRWLCNSLGAAGALLVACSAPNPLVDGGRTDGGACQPVCTGATPVCVPGVGCRTCLAGTRRCDPTSGNTPQTCSPDGAQWSRETPCPAGSTQQCIGGQCLDPCGAAAAQRSYIGCEYWPVTLQNLCMGEVGGTFPFAIVLANPQTTAVTATIDGGALTAPITQSIAPGQLTVIELPWVAELAQLRRRPGTSVLRHGGAYHVRTTLPVTAYQFNPLRFRDDTTRCGAAMDQPCFSYSNDASLLLPTSVLGQRYTALTFPGMTYRIGATMPFDAGGTIAVVGTTNGTQVTVHTTGSIVAGPEVASVSTGGTQTYQLAAGDVLQLLGGGEGNDFTGTTIETTQPVGVFNGHVCAQVPTDRVAGDHLEEQLFPDATWGRRYAITAFRDRATTPSLVRILAQRDATHLTFDPPPATPPATTTLGAHQFVEFALSDDTVVSADQPILVAQFMYGDGATGGEGDPAMVYEAPVEQYRNDYTFLAPDTYTHSFANVVGPNNTPPTLDGSVVTGTPRVIGASGLTAWSVPLTPGVHHLG